MKVITASLSGRSLKSSLLWLHFIFLTTTIFHILMLIYGGISFVSTFFTIPLLDILILKI